MAAAETRFRLLQILGRGGKGEVHLAEDTQLDRKVAIKFLSDDLRDDPDGRAMLGAFN